MKRLLVNLSVFAFFAALFVVSASSVGAQGGFPQTQTTVNFTKPSILGNLDVNPNSIFRFVINLLIIIGILVSLVFLLWGGLRWILSGGDKAKVDSARSTIVAAIVGLIIVILAYVIINTVLIILTGSGISGLTLPSLANPEGGRN